MKKIILSVLIVLIAVILFLFGRGFVMVYLLPTPTPKTFITPQLSNDKLWSLIENWRTSQGLKPFIKDQRLCKIADARVQQIQTDYSHTQFEKEYSNYPYVLQENLSSGTTEDLIFNKWLISEPHLETLKKPYTSSCVSCENFLCVQIFSSFKTDKNNPY